MPYDEYFTDESYASYIEAVNALKDSTLLKKDMVEYLTSLNLTDSVKDVIDSILVKMFNELDETMLDKDWVRGDLVMSSLLNSYLYVFYHAVNVGYKVEESETLIDIVNELINIHARHNVDMTHKIGFGNGVRDIKVVKPK